MPAKSGVAGGVLAVLPGQLGIGVFSPRLDPRGNSVRGVRACATVARDFDVHLLDGGRPAVLPIRSSYTLAEVSSRRVRLPAERAALDRCGSACRVIEVQGELELSAYERVADAALGHAAAGRIVLVDLTRVTRAEDGLESLLASTSSTSSRRSGHPWRSFPEPRGPFSPASPAGLEDASFSWPVISTRRSELCKETILLAGGGHSGPVTLSITDHPVVTRVRADLRAPLLDALGPRVLRPGETLCRSGDPADELFLVTAGRLTVVRPDGTRAATLSAGMVVGELGAAVGRRRCARRGRGDVRGVPCAALGRAAPLRRGASRRPRGCPRRAPRGDGDDHPAPRA